MNTLTKKLNDLISEAMTEKAKISTVLVDSLKKVATSLEAHANYLLETIAIERLEDHFIFYYAYRDNVNFSIDIEEKNPNTACVRYTINEWENISEVDLHDNDIDSSIRNMMAEVMNYSSYIGDEETKKLEELLDDFTTRETLNDKLTELSHRLPPELSKKFILKNTIVHAVRHKIYVNYYPYADTLDKKYRKELADGLLDKLNKEKVVIVIYNSNGEPRFGIYKSKDKKRYIEFLMDGEIHTQELDVWKKE